MSHEPQVSPRGTQARRSGDTRLRSADKTAALPRPLDDGSAANEHDDRAAIVTVNGPVRRSDIPELCRRIRTAMGHGRMELVACDLQTLTQCDMTVVHALARMQLTAQPRGRSIYLLHAPAQLLDVRSATGLDHVLPAARREPGQSCSDP
ncbi:MAG TPA: STAS domain-containing protein [Jiangellaceae bacterium]|nr:STAS domain-containing protein [Jiangellaceae bacterium]